MALDHDRSRVCASPFARVLVGLSFSLYAAPQGLLQVPFGWLSDRWGRKPVLTIGLLLLVGCYPVERLLPPPELRR